MVKIAAIEHAGLAAVELVERRSRIVIVHAVGPRIAWLSTRDGNNLLFWDDEGRHTRGAWRLYGGHRFWLTRPGADESEDAYQPDNEPCRVRELADGVAIIARPDRSQIEKTITVRARPTGWRVEHRVRNAGNMLWSGGAWALTCTLPRRSTQYHIPLGAPVGPWDVFTMVVPRRWGSGQTSRLADPQFRIGDDGIEARARGHEAKRMMFARQGTLQMRDPARGGFEKRADVVAGARYPLGTNLAIYLGPASFMVELETMSPIATLAPGESLRHVEHWKVDPPR
jgi:hypothetical protein